VVGWPHDARIAISIVVHFEEGAESTPLNGDPLVENATEGILIDQVSQVGARRRDERIESMYEYGPRCGFWRLTDIFEACGVKVTFFCAGQAAERNPIVAREITTLGHEACGHGYRWLPYHAFSSDEEAEDIRKGLEAVERATGQRPLGWHSRAATPRTRSLLLEAGGIVYDSDSYGDDLPYFAKTDSGQCLLTIPYNTDVNDDKFWVPPPAAGFTNPDAFSSVMRATFDRLWAEGATHPKMMSVGLHQRISGRPARAKQIERFIHYARGFPGVWFARRVDIARWWLEHGPKP
jgi:peptidoglycan/xylan/chitin deacetylase (PgdA/CDA1 family)